MPAPLRPGTRVWLVEVPGPMDSSTTAGTQFEAVLACAPQLTADGTGWLVDVQVDESVAASIAALGAVDRIAIVRRSDA